MTDNLWGGLFNRESSNSALLIGSYSEWWYYAIATISTQYKPCFPGPDVFRKIVYLWVKMPTDLRRLSCNRKKHIIQNNILMVNIIIVS